MFVYLGSVWIWGLSGKLDCINDLLLHFFVNGRHSDYVGKTFIQHPPTEARNRVFLHPTFNFLLRAIATIGVALIAHVVPTPAIRKALDEGRPVSGAARFHAAGGRASLQARAGILRAPCMSITELTDTG